MISFHPVTVANEKHFLTLLEENAMAGWVNMLLTRQPSYLASQHYFAQETPVLAEEAGQYLGCYQLTQQQAFINGVCCAVGYLNSLRVTARYRNKISVLKAGFAHLRQSDNIPPYCYTSIGSDNQVARRLLEKGIAGLPRYRPLGELCTLVIAKQKAKALGLWQLTQDYAAVVDFYNRQASAYQLAPYLSLDWLKQAQLPVLVYYQQQQIVACAVLWNQQAFKQVIVNHYHPLVSWLRPLYNGYAHLTQRPKLPPINHVLDQSFLAFLQVQDETLLLPLLRDALCYCKTELLTLSLAQGYPQLTTLIKTCKAMTYQTTLYGVDLVASPTWQSHMLKPEAAIL